MRDFLKGLDFDKETIDSIMAEYGKLVQGLKETNEELTGKVNTYEAEIKTLKESSKYDENWKEKFETLDTKIKEQEAENKKKQEDEMLTNNIISVFGDRKFTSDYVKSSQVLQKTKQDYLKILINLLTCQVWEKEKQQHLIIWMK